MNFQNYSTDDHQPLYTPNLETGYNYGAIRRIREAELKKLNQINESTTNN